MGSTPPTADTFGWDTVFAISYDAVNAAIVNDQSSPANYNFRQPSNNGNQTISGDFGAWQLVSGGGDQNVNMTLPITNGVLTSGSDSYNYEGTLTIQVQLAFVPAEVNNSPTGADVNLQVTRGSGGENAVTFLNMSYTGTSLPITQGFIFQGLMTEWLDTNILEFGQIFSTVNLNAQLDTSNSAFQWLQPTTSQYATSDTSDGSVGVLGVLSMTQGRSDANLGQEISPQIIPSGSNAGFLISYELFLKQLMLPNIQILFMGSTVDDFTLTGDESQIQNTNTLKFQKMQLGNDDKTMVEPELAPGNFTLTILDNQLELQFTEISYPYSDDITVKLNYTSIGELSLNDNGSLKFTEISNRVDGSPVVSNESVWTEVGTQVALGIAGALVGAGLGAALGIAGNACVRAAPAAGEAAIEGGVEMAEAAAEVGDDVVEANAIQVVEGAANAAEDVVQGNAEAVAQYPGWLARNWPTLLGAVIGSSAGAVTAEIPDIIASTQNNNAGKTTPKAQNFALTLIQPITWPSTSDFTLESVSLNGALQLDGNFTVTNQ